MAYVDTLKALAGTAERDVLTAYRSFVDGLLDQDETVKIIATIIARANGRARMLADNAIALEVMVQLGEAIPTPEIDVPDDTERLELAAATVLVVAAKSDVPEAIVARLARSEPLEAAANAYSDAMVRSGKTKGWVRQLHPGACQLCQWWSRDGRIWPAEHPFQHHKGCTCTPKPVVAKNIRETEYTARLSFQRAMQQINDYAKGVTR